MKLALIGALIGTIIGVVITIVFNLTGWICFANGFIFGGAGTMIGLFADLHLS